MVLWVQDFLGIYLVEWSEIVDNYVTEYDQKRGWYDINQFG